MASADARPDDRRPHRLGDRRARDQRRRQRDDDDPRDRPRSWPRRRPARRVRPATAGRCAWRSGPARRSACSARAPTWRAWIRPRSARSRPTSTSTCSARRTASGRSTAARETTRPDARARPSPALFSSALDRAGLSSSVVERRRREPTTSSFDNFAIPTGGLFSGANEIKTPEQAALFGGTAGVPEDPCYHLACDTVDNIDPVLLEEMARARGVGGRRAGVGRGRRSARR